MLSQVLSQWEKCKYNSMDAPSHCTRNSCSRKQTLINAGEDVAWKGPLCRGG